MEKANIVCLKWGTLYSADYVNRLYRAVKRHTTIPVQFHCFTEDSTDIDPNIEIHPLPNNALDGWWNKLYLFSAELPVKGRIFFVDLDTLITNNIDDLLQVQEGFVVLRDFYHGVARGVEKHNIGSGLMSFESGKYDYMWQKFIDNPTKIVQRIKPHGDQRYIQQEVTGFLYWQDLFPDQVTSFKVHCSTGLPEKAAVVCYHGKPSIPDSITKHTKVPHFNILPQAWVKDHWR